MKVLVGSKKQIEGINIAAETMMRINHYTLNN